MTTHRGANARRHAVRLRDRALFAGKVMALVLLAIEFAPQHHGHIVLFLTDVRERLLRLGGARIRGATIVQESSRLELRLGDVTHYEVSVRRKTRSLEVALCLDGTREETAAMRGVLVERSDDLRAGIASTVELEEPAKGRVRLGVTRVLSRADWSPKRDLTPALVDETAALLLRFVRVVEPMLRLERAARLRASSRRK